MFIVSDMAVTMRPMMARLVTSASKDRRRSMSSFPLLKDKAYVNGAWVGAESGAVFPVTNPMTGEVFTISIPTILHHILGRCCVLYQTWIARTLLLL